MSGQRPPTPPQLEHGKVQRFCACRQNNDGSWQGDEFDCVNACGDILTSLKNQWKPYLIRLNQQWKDAEQEMWSRRTAGAASREAAAKRRCADEYERYQVKVEQVTNTYKDHIGQDYPLLASQWPDHQRFDMNVFN